MRKSFFSVAIDLGGSTVDIVLFFKNYKIKSIVSLESKEVNKNELSDIFVKSKIDYKKIQNIIITGGHNRFFPDFFKNIPIYKSDEIKSIGIGGTYLSKLKDALVISMGTGTCMVSVKKNKCSHIGGTGVGGGTLIGLSKLLLNEKDPFIIENMTRKGNLRTVDISVKDIVGNGIGIIPGFATASNFGKSQECKREDIAMGICNLIGQTIASLSIFAARTYNHKNIVLTGKLVRMKKIVHIIKKTASLYKRKIILPKNAEYAPAIGAMVHILKIKKCME